MAHHPVSGWLGLVAFLALLGAGGVFFMLAVRMRVAQLLQAKRPDVRWDTVGERVRNFFVYVMAQKKLPKNGYWYSGVLHMFIFGAFVVLSVDTVNFILDGLLKGLDVVRGLPPSEAFHLPLSKGPYEGLADTFRLLCIVGLGMAFVNRTIIRPKRLPLTRDAMYTLFFILGLMSFEVAQCGFDLALRGKAAGALPENYTWFSAFFAQAVLPLDEDALTLGYRAAWWCHLVNLLAFSNYVPYSKHSHVFASPLNMFVMDTAPKGRIRTLKLDAEAEDIEYFGARTLEDLSWKQLFDGLSCTECGRCTDNCPAALSGKPLRPMYIITDLKHHMEDRYKRAQAGEKIDLTDPSALLAGGVIHPDVLWSCTTCRACMEVCPVGNEHIPAIIDMRRYMALSEGEPGFGSGKALKKMEKQGNPWGMPKNEREGWAEGMDIKRWTKEGDAEVLYWVGCAGAYDDRAKKVTQSVSRLMKKAGVDFAILGNKERCTGESARRIGEENLFQQLATENIETMNKAGVKKIVTGCPHCFNTLKNEYSEFGGKYEVMHHSELLSKLVSEGKLTPSEPEQAEGEAPAEKEKVVYHDSCYLGRYNDVYDPQRDIIDALPDVQRVETDRNRERGLCCGAGGGQMWMESDLGERMNFVRTDELLANKPKVIAVACNFCMTMVGDGVKARSQEENVEVLDLAELLDRRVK